MRLYLDFLPALVLFTISAAFTPGPNNIMIMASGLNFGVRRSVPHLVGICFGFPTLVIAIGFGAGYLFDRFPNLHEMIKLIGVLYLSYLAWRIATAVPGHSAGDRSKPFTIIEAALFQWVNPKAWIMATSAIATYTTVGQELAPQIGMIVLVFFLMTWPAAGAWLLFGTSLQRILATPVKLRVFNVSMAMLLLASMYSIVQDLIRQYLW